jgi:hypothetical protein
MNVPYLRELAFERFISLLLNRSEGDTRSGAELRQIAARQVVNEAQREARLAAKSQTTPLVENTSSNSFEVLFAKIWRIVTTQATYRELMQRRKSQATPKPKITIDSNPVIVDEPVNWSDVTPNVVQFPTPAPLVVSGIRSATRLDDSQFPKLGGMADETTNNWRNSILQNESIAKERERRSLEHRNSQNKYVG